MTLEQIKIATDSTLWVEKYKPTTIEDVLIEEHLKVKFREFINSKDIPGLLLSGSSGNGKTSCAKIIAKAITDEPGDVMFINASSESGIDTVRHKIEPFCAVQSFGSGFKIVILDEMEMSSEHFQTALREVIEKFYKTTRFIFTCNFINKVIEPLKSRTQEFKFGDINKLDIMKRLFAILKQEGVEFKKEDVAAIIKDLGTDMRRIINTMQKLTEKREDGSLYLTRLSSLDEKQNELLDLIKNKKLTDFRKSLSKSNIGADEFIKFLFNKSFDKQLGNRWVEIIAELSEAAYRLKLGVDPEITVMNTVCQVMQLIEE